MSWPVADACLALFHHAFDYPVKTEGETLEHIGTYAGQLPFMADSHLRPDGYGLLDQQLLQSMPLPTPKYSRCSNGFEIPPYVGNFLVRGQSDYLRPTWLVIFSVKLSVSSAPGSPCLPDPHRSPCFCFSCLVSALTVSLRAVLGGFTIAVRSLAPSRWIARYCVHRTHRHGSWFVTRIVQRT